MDKLSKRKKAVLICGPLDLRDATKSGRSFLVSKNLPRRGPKVPAL